ncbi:NAD kinase [Polycladidibacter hongkongensis]|uniref:NAD kinase n=1 Tax=Polycladidibacter hongkongensis TaxID=1647556 RepID=UPI00082AC521|nr:NAD kinase [Pseudovibrio hongkongensis]
MRANKIQSIALVSSGTPEAEAARIELEKRYACTNAENADAIIALGGDGMMLQCLHTYMNTGKPVYGMNRGSVGFMMNEFRPDGLLQRLAAAELRTIHPLNMEATDTSGNSFTARALNEVSLLRQTHQAAKLRIQVDGRERLEELICDGTIVATPVGSTAYNLSAHGPILPMDAPLLALTPISAFRPRRWRGALLPNRSTVHITVREADKRPVSATADHQEFRHVTQVSIFEDATSSCLLMFDSDHNWDERILTEMFRY